MNRAQKIKRIEIHFNNDLCRMYEIKDLLLYETVYNTQQAEELCELSPSKYR